MSMRVFFFVMINYRSKKIDFVVKKISFNTSMTMKDVFFVYQCQNELLSFFLFVSTMPRLHQTFVNIDC